MTDTLLNELLEVVQEKTWMDYQQYLSDREPVVGQRVKVFCPQTLYSRQTTEYSNIKKLSKTQIMLDNGDRYVIATGRLVGSQGTKFDRTGPSQSIYKILADVTPSETSLVDEATRIAENASMGGMSAGGVATTVSPKKKGKKKSTIVRRDSIFV
jgi:hypothetical protein